MAQTIINDARVFRLMQTDDGAEAPNIISVDAGAVVTVAMDFSAVLNPGTGLAAVSSVTIATGSSFATPIDGSTAVSDDTRQALATVTTASDEAGERKLKFTCTTTDSQTLTGEGYFHVL